MAIVLPAPSASFIGPDGRPVHDWYAILQQWAEAFNATANTGNSSATDLAALQTTVAELPASIVEMEAAASVAKFVSPGRAHRHPGVAKATLKCGVAADIQTSYGVTSLVDTGTGRVTVNFTTSFSSADYTIAASALNSTARVVTVESQAAGSVGLLATDAAAPSTGDPTNYFVSAFGDL